jgi:hypothetical protein
MRNNSMLDSSAFTDCAHMAALRRIVGRERLTAVRAVSRVALGIGARALELVVVTALLACAALRVVFALMSYAAS